jgi:hypothetical protein
MPPSILITSDFTASASPTKSEIRTLCEAETKAVAAGTAVISSEDLGGGAQPDGGSHGMRADRIYRK